jgi:hypothetical protein
MEEVELLRQRLAQLEAEKACAEARAEAEKARADGLDNLLKAQEMSLKACSLAGLVV